MQNGVIVGLDLESAAGTVKISVRYEAIAIHVEDLSEHSLEGPMAGQSSAVDLFLNLL
jgi:hypothetical protein